MLSVATETADQHKDRSPAAVLPSPSIVQFTVGLCVALATIGVGMYAL